MGKIISHNGEYGYVFFDKICQKCTGNIKLLELPNPPEILWPIYEDVYIIEEDNKFKEVCKKCYEQYKSLQK